MDKGSVLIPQMVPLSVAGRDETPNYTNKVRQIGTSSGFHRSLTGCAQCRRVIVGLDSTAVGTAV